MEPIIQSGQCFHVAPTFPGKHESLKEYFLAMVQGGCNTASSARLKDVSLDIMPGDFTALWA